MRSVYLFFAALAFWLIDGAFPARLRPKRERAFPAW